VDKRAFFLGGGVWVVVIGVVLCFFGGVWGFGFLGDVVGVWLLFFFLVGGGFGGCLFWVGLGAIFSIFRHSAHFLCPPEHEPSLLFLWAISFDWFCTWFAKPFFAFLVDWVELGDLVRIRVLSLPVLPPRLPPSPLAELLP